MTSHQNFEAEKIEAVDAEGKFWSRDHERDIWISFAAEDDKEVSHHPVTGKDPASYDASRYEIPKNLDESPCTILRQLDAELEINILEEPSSFTDNVMKPCKEELSPCMEFDMKQSTRILDPTVGTEPIGIKEIQNTNMGSIYDK